MEVNKSIFRENDIRGIYPEQLNEFTISKIAKAIAVKCKKENIESISVGRDGRLSGESLLSSFCDSLIDSGINVTNIGMVTSPMLYFEAKTNKTKSGIIITGSHNPKNHNGLKMVVNDRPVSGIEILSLIESMESKSTSKGELKTKDIKEKYLDEVINSISIKNPSNYKVVIDCGNGAAGCVAPDLFKRVGCEVVELYTEVDGNFPNHHHDPSKLENLQDLIDSVIINDADLGLAFDGDADRLGVISSEGEMIFPDMQMILFSRQIIKDKPNAKIVFDVKCSKLLSDEIMKLGGKPLICKTGHTFIKQKIREEEAFLGGEMSGHIFFNDSWNGFDDGLYAAARLLEVICNSDTDKVISIDCILSKFDDSCFTPEILVPIPETEKFELMEKLTNYCNFGDAQITTLDGLRVERSQSWGLIRASNTTPNLTLRFEANNNMELKCIKAHFQNKLKPFIKKIEDYI